jgi:hypothetical protein
MSESDSWAGMAEILRDLADAYAEGDEEAVATLVYEIYCDYHKEGQE